MLAVKSTRGCRATRIGRPCEERALRSLVLEETELIADGFSSLLRFCEARRQIRKAVDSRKGEERRETVSETAEANEYVKGE